MSCCLNTSYNFVNQSVTVIPFIGATPTVDVYYWDGLVWAAAGIFTLISISATAITVDHGGSATGRIKITA